MWHRTLSQTRWRVAWDGAPLPWQPRKHYFGRLKEPTGILVDSRVSVQADGSRAMAVDENWRIDLERWLEPFLAGLSGSKSLKRRAAYYNASGQFWTSPTSRDGCPTRFRCAPSARGSRVKRARASIWKPCPIPTFRCSWRSWRRQHRHRARRPALHHLQRCTLQRDEIGRAHV